MNEHTFDEIVESAYSDEMSKIAALAKLEMTSKAVGERRAMSNGAGILAGGGIGSLLGLPGMILGGVIGANIGSKREYRKYLANKGMDQQTKEEIKYLIKKDKEFYKNNKAEVKMYTGKTLRRLRGKSPIGD